MKKKPPKQYDVSQSHSIIAQMPCLIFHGAHLRTPARALSLPSGLFELRAQALHLSLLSGLLAIAHASDQIPSKKLVFHCLNDQAVCSRNESQFLYVSGPTLSSFFYFYMVFRKLMTLDDFSWNGLLIDIPLFQFAQACFT